MKNTSKLVSTMILTSLIMLACITGCSSQNDEQVISTITAINTIGEVSLDSNDSICAAEGEYEKLSDKQKEAVSNHDVLTAARETYEALIQKEISEVETAISNIGDVSLDKAEAIDYANNLYGALPDDEKNRVSNHKQLKDAISTISLLEKQRDEETREIEKQRENEAKAFSISDSVSTNHWDIALTDAYVSATLQSAQSRTYWTPSDGTVFLILEFDVEALTSDKLAIDSSALTNIVATYNNNTYKYFDMRYVASDLWLPAERRYLDANIPTHVYVYTALPVSALDDGTPISVDLKVAGQDKHLNVR